MSDLLSELDLCYEADGADGAENFLQNKLIICSEEEKVALLNELATLYRNSNRFALAENYYRQAINILEKQNKVNSHEYGVVLLNFGGVYRLSGDLQRAERMYRHALRLLDRQDTAYAGALNNLAIVLQEQNKLDEAVAFLQETLEWLQLGLHIEEEATTLTNIATLYLQQSDLQKAKTYLEQAQKKFEELPFMSGHQAAVYCTKSMLHCACHEWKDAEAALEAALVIIETVCGRTVEYDIIKRNLEDVRRLH